MGTDRPRIQAYIDPELYQKLKEFQALHGLKESAALNQILKEYFGLEVSNQPLASPFPIEEMIEKSIDEKFKEFNVFRGEFKNEVWLQLKAEFNIWNQELQRVSNKIKQRDFNSLNSRLEALEEICKPIEGLAELSKPMEKSSELPSELNLSQLARRLEVSKSVVSNRKARPDFEEWSKGKDPDAITWRYDRKHQKFFPVEDRA